MKFDVYGIGNPLVDIVVRVSDKELKDLKLKRGSAHVVGVNDFNRVNKIIKNKNKIIGPAGSCANTMMSLANLGCKAVLAGKIGNDENGFEYEKEIHGCGVIPNLVKQDGTTGSCISFITPDCERTMITYLGVSKKFCIDDINEDNILNSKFLHIEGYQLDTPSQKRAVLHAINLAKDNGVKVSFDLADPLFVKRHKSYLPKIIEKSDIVFANEEEAKTLTNLKPEEAINMINAETVIIKKGVSGSIIKDKNRLIKIKSYKANTVDTTGAGDVYASGILYGLSKGYDLELCGKIASYAAAKIVEHLGTRFVYSMRQRVSWIVNYL